MNTDGNGYSVIPIEAILSRRLFIGFVFGVNPGRRSFHSACPGLLPFGLAALSISIHQRSSAVKNLCGFCVPWLQNQDEFHT